MTVCTIILPADMKILALCFVTWFLVYGFARADETGIQFEWVNQSRAQLQRHFDDGEYTEAMQIAEDIVSRLDTGSNASSHLSATAIHNLAVTQLVAGKLEDSEQNFTHSISMIEEIRGSYSPLMIP